MPRNDVFHFMDEIRVRNKYKINIYVKSYLYWVWNRFRPLPEARDNPVVEGKESFC